MSNQQVFSPSPRNYGDIISAVVQHRDLTYAWTLYDELIEKGLSPHQETWEVLFTGSEGTENKEGEEEKMGPQSEHEQRLLGILHDMRNNQIYPQKNLAESIKTWFER